MIDTGGSQRETITIPTPQPAAKGTGIRGGLGNLREIDEGVKRLKMCSDKIKKRQATIVDLTQFRTELRKTLLDFEPGLGEDGK